MTTGGLRGRWAQGLAYYQDKGILRRVDGQLAPDDVADRIRALLATLQMEEQL